MNKNTKYRKLLLSLGLLTSLASFEAQASKARMIALGQDKNGSSYIEDTRMIFLNPALLNKQADFANFELGSSTVGSTPNAEGGFFHKVGNYKLGLQLGRETDLSSLIALSNNAFSSLALTYPHNSFEAQIAGSNLGSMKWGASVIYGSNEEKAEAQTFFPQKKSNTLEFHGGVLADKWDAHAALDLYGNSENQTSATATNKLSLNPSIKLGGAYELSGEQKAFVETAYSSFTTRLSSESADRSDSYMYLTVGYAHFIPADTTTKFFYSVGLTASSYKMGGIGGANDYKIDQYNIPVVIGVENMATDWLKLRASVSQKILIDQQVTTVTNSNNPNSTSVAAGVGIKWKKVDFDATLAGGDTGKVDGNAFLANASLSYFF